MSQRSALMDHGDGTAVLTCAPGFEAAGSFALTITITDDGVPPATATATFVHRARLGLPIQHP